MAPATTLHDIKTLILSCHPVLAIETLEEDRVRGLLRAVAGEVKAPMFEWSLTRGLQRVPGGRAIHGTAEPLGLMKHLRTLTVHGLFHLKDFSVHLTDAALVRTVRDVTQQFAKTRATLVVTGDPITLPPELAVVAVQMRLQLPTPRELKAVLTSVLAALRADHRIEVAIDPDDLESVIQAMGGLTVAQARQALSYVVLEDGRLARDDIPKLIARKAQVVQESGLLEYLPSGHNTFELGGFARLKAWLDRARVGFSPEARSLNLSPPRGVMVVGVQGCGKSLAAKVIGREWELPLLKLDAGRLYDKYVGETEKNLRRATEMAATMAPAVLWLDEIEKALGSGGDQDGGVSRRLLGSFLTWLQEHDDGVFVVATANDLASLPPELLRKGRFDEIFFVDLPEAGERREIFDIHLALRKQTPAAFNLDQLVGATDGFSGAEIEQVVISGLYRALHRRAPLGTSLLLEEVSETVPLSVSRR